MHVTNTMAEGFQATAGRGYPRDMVEHLRTLAVERPADTALITVDAQGDTFIDYATLDRRVRALAGELQARFAPGDRALLMLNNDAHYVVAFFACLYSNLTAVTVFPPESARGRHLERLAGIASDSQARCVLTTTAILELLASEAAIFNGATPVAIDVVDQASCDHWRRCPPSDSDIAFLQYTSGSTAAPKGVMVSHGNMLANARAFEERMAIGADDVFVTWLPLYHDMGLISGLLQPIHRGVPVALMSPMFFFERPLRWLEAISRHRGSVSGAPDFAFRLCVERIGEERRRGLDLSSWRVAYCGAEPVRHDTFAAFVERFEPAGFTPGAYYPCYGLAEGTLFVTGGRRGAGPIARRFSPRDLADGVATLDETGTLLVACGFASSADCVKIVEPDALIDLEDGRIGEIWVSGPSVARGYWRRPKESDETFVERGGRRWLRTGDLGFMHDGELYIAGRRKDLIILRGQNVYPQDIERAVEDEVEAIRKGRVAAFVVDLPCGGEGVGVAAEVSRGLQKLVPSEALVRAIGEAVSAVCGEAPAVTVLLNPRGLPKTSSGKVQRSACRDGWRSRTLDAYAICEHGRFVLGGGDAIGADLPQDEIEAAVAGIWRDALRRDAPLGRQSQFFAVGGNSLAAADVARRIAERWGIEFPVRLMFERPRLADCAAEVGRRATKEDFRPRVVIPALSASRREQPLPLSHAQQRQWFLWRLGPTSAVNHVSGAFRLSGALDLTALRAAFDGLVARHEALRTLFRVGADGAAEQSILSESRLDAPVIDLAAMARDQRERCAMREARRIAAEPFDLCAAPPARVAILRLAEDDHILLVVMHHIISDGASMQILLEELAALYSAHLTGGAASLRHMPIQYADYAVWRRDRVDAGECERQLAYWRRQLGDEHPVLALPVDHPRRALGELRAARQAFEIPTELLDHLRRLAAEQGTTLFVALLAGFQALLYRYTGERDIRVGAPVARRDHAEIEGVVGLFVDTLVLRGLTNGRMSLASLLEQARDVTTAALAHQDLPFEMLVEALQPERSLGHNPLAQVTINHVIEDFETFRRTMGLEQVACDVIQPAVQFELTLDIRESHDGRLRAAFVYAADLFEPSAIERFARRYLAMLRALAERPEQSLGDVALLDDAESAWLADHGGGALRRPDCLDEAPVHRLVEQRARMQPGAVALIHDERTLDYAQMNRLANRIAHRLIGAGVRPEDRVGVAVERSIEMVVCLLAVLKAGGAYVPLDPDYPSERLAYMMRDSGVALLLTQRSLHERMPVPAGARVIDIDDADDIGVVPEHDPAVPLHAENLAYVIYTSGSTGRPKGVCVAHGPLAKHIRAIADIYGVTPRHRELMFFSPSFDASAEQWMTPLSGGGTVVLCGREQLAGDSFMRLVADHAVTALHVSPGYLRLIAPLAGPAAASVRVCIVGGEAWSGADYAAAQAAFPKARLVNAYGPTETVITPTAWVGGADMGLGAESAPIGRPIGTRSVHVLDEDMNRAPPGVAGELYVGGIELARGYLGAPQATSERFVADPFDADGGRLYRTGDLVRWRANGQLEYLGRLDHQVKIRGFRVELGEIEARLLCQPGVREAAAVTYAGAESARIVAYVAPQPGAQLEERSLQAALAAELPDYMLPRTVVLVEALPLTANGKLDREALPMPELGAGGEAPSSELEIAIAGLWAEALGVAHVGLHDNFFDLGGHSLLLLKLHRWLAERLGLRVTLVDLFRHGTVGALAAHLSGDATAFPSVAQSIRERASLQRSRFLPPRRTVASQQS
jgi:amino acid adenylation domain-containing protein